MITQLDDWRREQEDLPTRPEAIRRIVKDWLIGHGLLSPAPEIEEGDDQPK
ncbi:hypothetical protein FHS55_002120 [Angulomicrobium tetraedrale]|uniref:Ribbon-helix-helix protein CopG domain-containing protein n=1 Tax=Ancylobacter tetraedralis TaxID=217068 RepID=A0A839Z9V7_9HYPH|nr:hypothetical protein [Ancylobacter tetraedralis]MBB3771521.1 hypothetical protein [Ancylobacter tetraedralis]